MKLETFRRQAFLPIIIYIECFLVQLLFHVLLSLRHFGECEDRLGSLEIYNNSHSYKVNVICTFSSYRTAHVLISSIVITKANNGSYYTSTYFMKFIRFKANGGPML